MAIDFKSLLAKPASEIKRPPALPACTLHGTIKGYKYDESRFGITKEQPDEKYGVVIFTLLASEADPTSVDPALLNDSDGKPLDLNRRPHTREMPISGGNEYSTVAMLEALGISKEGRSLGEMIPDSVGANVSWEVTQRADNKDPNIVYNDVRNVRPRA